jgi:hypothetical protein
MYRTTTSSQVTGAIYPTTAQLIVSEGGYEYLIEDKFINEANRSLRPLLDMITLPSNVTSVAVNMDPRNSLRDRVHGLTHLSPIPFPGGDLFSETVTITEPVSILQGDITIRADGTIEYKDHTFSPFLAPLYSRSTTTSTTKNLSGYVEYTEGLISDQSSGDVYPCFSIYYGNNYTAPEVAYSNGVDFQIIFIDLGEGGEYDILYRYKHYYFDDIGAATNISVLHYPVENVYTPFWLRSFYDTGFNLKSDYTIAGDGAQGGVVIGHNVLEDPPTNDRFILSGSTQDPLSINALYSSSLGSLHNGDWIFRGTPTLGIEGYNQVYLIEDGTIDNFKKQCIASFDFDSDFFVYILFEQMTGTPEEIEEQGTGKITVFLSSTDIISDGITRSWIPPIFSAQVTGSDSIGDPLLGESGKTIIRFLSPKTMP